MIWDQSTRKGHSHLKWISLQGIQDGDKKA